MKTLKNAPFYLVIVAIANKDYKHINQDFKVGDEWIVDQNVIRTPGYDNKDELFVKRKNKIDFMGYDVFRLPLSNFDLKVKKITPQFKVGDVIIRIGAVAQTIPSRISSYNLSNGTIWYQDEFGDRNNLASGHEEDSVRLATPEEIEKSSMFLLSN